MPTVKKSSANLDRRAILAELAARRVPSEADIAAFAAEDHDAWSDKDLALAEVIFPPPTPQQVRALRDRLDLSQARFARRFGFTVDTIRQYEQGRRVPSGPAAILLRVIAAEPEAVIRALDPRRVRDPATDPFPPPSVMRL